MISDTLTIRNRLGLHARAAAKLVSLASRFDCQLSLSRGDHRVNAKSIMGVMMLAAARGTELELEARGPDEAEALAAIRELVDGRFGESE